AEAPSRAGGAPSAGERRKSPPRAPRAARRLTGPLTNDRGTKPSPTTATFAGSSATGAVIGCGGWASTGATGRSSLRIWARQAFVSQIRGINRPVDLKFGPDDCAYLVDYGAVRDFGQSDPDSKVQVAGDGPLVQIPGTGVIWKICRTAAREKDDRDDD